MVPVNILFFILGAARALMQLTPIASSQCARLAPHQRRRRRHRSSSSNYCFVLLLAFREKSARNEGLGRYSSPARSLYCNLPYLSAADDLAA